MSERFRYLPCALHEALVVFGAYWAPMITTHPPEVRVSGERPMRHVLDLANPHGWDHAVRALAAIKGTELLESSSVAFDDEFRVPGVERFVFSEHPPRGATLMWTKRASTSPAARREALCRCICAALNLRVEEVFP